MRDIRFGRSRADMELIGHLEGMGARGSYLKYAMRALGVEQSNTRWAATRFALSIRNEANLTGSDNVGGSTAAPAAPEVAADDDDGDGDGDPEPERRPRHRNTLPPTVEHFDRLPDSAHVDIAALKAITGKSRATLYRWIDRGILPKPRKLGLTHNFWTAGDVRRALQG